MKAKIKTVIFVLIVVILAGWYSIIDKGVSVYDVKCDNSEFAMLKLNETEGISQEFISSEENIDGISLKLAVDDESRKDDVTLDYKLLMAENGQTLASGETGLSELKSGKFFEIPFNSTLTDCKNKKLRFELNLKHSEENAITVYYTPGTSDTTELLYDGDKIDGVNVMRTITHRFDLETFVVSLCFIAYIVFFMRWLYKLFE